jgi:hypothetical protein
MKDRFIFSVLWGITLIAMVVAHFVRLSGGLSTGSRSLTLRTDQDRVPAQ